MTSMVSFSRRAPKAPIYVMKRAMHDTIRSIRLGSRRTSIKESIVLSFSWIIHDVKTIVIKLII